ncbi:MAG TPA: hypothetical protein VGG39_13055 [Polyangiaceae bacterium]|jgi:hypothetical protein
MIVGREHIVGAGRDYDELMEMGAEALVEPPPPHHPAPPQLHPGPPAPEVHHHHHHPSPPHGHHPHAPHMVAVHPSAPQFYSEEHHHHHGGHPGHHAPPPPPAHHDRHVGRTRIHSEEPQHERQFPIGFELTNIAAGDEEDIEVKPQVLFRGERLAIAQSIARYFDVLDIKVGKDSQLAATGPLTGEAFETRAVGVRMELDTAQPGIVITLRVKNIDTAAHDFKAVLYGRVLE